MNANPNVQHQDMVVARRKDANTSSTVATLICGRSLSRITASMALEMLAEFQTLIFLQYHAATPMLLGGERVAFRMLEF